MVEGLFPYFASHLCISAEASKLVEVSNTYWLLNEFSASRLQIILNFVQTKGFVP